MVKHSYYYSYVVTLGKHSHYENNDLVVDRENCCIDVEMVALIRCVSKFILNYDCTEKCAFKELRIKLKNIPITLNML